MEDALADRLLAAQGSLFARFMVWMRAVADIISFAVHERTGGNRGPGLAGLVQKRGAQPGLLEKATWAGEEAFVLLSSGAGRFLVPNSGWPPSKDLRAWAARKR